MAPDDFFGRAGLFGRGVTEMSLAAAPGLSDDRAPFASPVRAPTRYDNRITLQKLEVLCAVVELEGVSRAADHLWVAQSVVSGHLRSLQDRLGVQVLYRDGQRMRLTEAGEEVYRWASETLSETRELMRNLDELDETSSGTLTVSASLTVGSYMLPPILADLRRARTLASIAMAVSDPEQAFAAVGSGECHLGVVIAEAGHEHPHVQCEVIGLEDIVLVAPPDYRPEIERLPLADLSGFDLVAAPAGNVGREFVDRQLVRLGVAPQNVVMELGHPEAMKRVIRTGIGAALLFRSCVADELEQGSLREVPLMKGDAPAGLELPVLSVTRANRRPGPMETQLIRQTRSYLERGRVPAAA